MWKQSRICVIPKRHENKTKKKRKVLCNEFADCEISIEDPYGK